MNELEIVVHNGVTFMVMQKLDNCRELIVPIAGHNPVPTEPGIFNEQVHEHVFVPKQPVKLLLDLHGLRYSCHSICGYDMHRLHVRCFRCRIRRVMQGSLPAIHPVRVFTLIEIDTPKYRALRKWVIKQMFRFIMEPVSNA